ncbi:MAG: hypothetical protein WCF64_04835 [Methylocella sp.]
MSQVHSQGERYVQQGRLIALTGQAGAKNGSNSNRLREIGAESKIPAILIAANTELDLEMLRDENHWPCRRHHGAGESCRGCDTSLTGTRSRSN